MTDDLHPLLTALVSELAIELEELALSADPADTDEPVREAYETRLRGLQQAARVVQDASTTRCTR